MPQKKIKHVQILNEKLRKATLKRRINSLFKKALELSILCGTEIFIISHDRNEGITTLWPSQDEVMGALIKFRNIPEQERLKKMVVQEELMMDLVKDMSQNVSKLQKKNKEEEMERLVNQLIHGLSVNEISTSQLDGLSSFVDEKLEKLQKRKGEIDESQEQLPQIEYSQLPGKAKGQSSGVSASNSVSSMMENMRKDKWFIETMYGF